MGRAARALVALVAFAIAGAAGCKSSGSSHQDAGAEGGIDVKPNTDTSPSDTRDAHVETAPPCMVGDAPGAIGATCTCDGQCAGGHCADGVCCNTACTEGCKTCASPSAPGTCVNRGIGDAPRAAANCAVTPVSTCGLDGKCDGTGACRKYPVNTTCKPGTCEGDAVVGSYACDGKGACKPGSTRICVPFSCDPTSNDCVETCTSSSQCVSGQQCVNGSCGKRMKGGSCKANADCASNFCADGVCCNVACQGPCLSCNLTGREGTCWPVDADKVDPRGICHDMGAPSCGQTGLCDGLGGCSKYARDTQCIAPTCSSGNRLNTAGTCDGLGTCSAPGIQNCHPFRCANGACTTMCVTNADCDTGIACVGGTCGPKQDGQSCTAASECEHSHCVDGVCCDTTCTGACKSCALPSMLGHCSSIAAGTADPRAMCVSMPQQSCGTNGKCDGNGGCQSWPIGTLCADETCNPMGNVYKAPSTCNGTGQCMAQDLVACSPFICNGSRCFIACTMDSQCVPPNTCINNSCGLKDPGGSCSDGKECKSTFCAQGVCCDKACDGACKSCIAGQLGQCTDVTNGAIDPTGKCAVLDSATCGTNGKCQAGACQKWGPGTPCKPSTCPTATNLFTALSTCDGAGVCQTPATTSCFPYRCGAAAACNGSCAVDGDCLPPATCVSGGCGLKPNGAVCASKVECVSNFCEQGICCSTACTGICKSCALTASRGTCSNISDGAVDIMSRCSDQGPTSCGTDGLCDGKGACRLYGVGTTCASATCTTGSTKTNARTCNGLGVCQTATTTACAPYVCNGTTACLGTCTSDKDCLSPNICDPKTSHCGNLKRLGQSCAATSECLTGNFCVDGVCCSTNGCTLCQSCNVGAAAGNCANVPAGTPDTMNRCAASPPCGNTGMCNGAGGCQLAPTTASCGTQSCTGSTITPLSHCNGTGACLAPTATNCSPYVCGGDTCRTNCAMDSHCLSPNTCQGTAPNRSCALKPPGTACTAGNQCISGACVDGVCCQLAAGSTSCGTCKVCNVSGTGTCTNIAAGTAAPAGQCAANGVCGNTGTCNGGGACTQALASVPCGAGVSCSGTTFQPPSYCTGTGTCNQLPTQTCGNYICGSSTACRTNCTADAQCANTNLYCTGNTTTAGSCVAKKANGATCNGPNECGSGNCVDGVCCSTGSCPACQACNVNATGICANVSNGSAEPHGRCAANGVCGNTTFCVGGACEQKPASTACGLAQSCSGTTYQPPSHCSGTGACSQTSTSDCVAYQCGASACKSSCTSATETADCAGGYFCLSGTCTAKRGANAACNGDNQCVSGHCTDGVCCGAASCPTCQACNVNGMGTCAKVGVVSEPHGRCSTNGPCGNTGACDGNGNCQQQPSSLTCGAPVSCSGATYQPQSFCSGSGTCNQMGTMSCGGQLVCNAAGTACRTSCDPSNNDTDCVGGTYCSGPGGTCLSKRAAGKLCAADHECTTGHCADGVCCNAVACGTCFTCNGSDPGNCTAAGVMPPAAPAAVPDPHGGCMASSPCGNTGLCLNGACQQTSAGTVCSNAFCATATKYQPSGSCTGAGGCSVPAQQDCGVYACSASGCPVTCTSDSQCVGAFYCNGNPTTPGSCVAKQDVGGCTRDAQCGSGHCGAEGVCCNLAACPQCQSCKVTGSEGTCTNVPADTTDPSGACLNQGAASCGTNGRCTMAGACELYDLATVCSKVCLAPTFTTFFCDGIGGCSVPQIETCTSSLTCDANGCLP